MFKISLVIPCYNVAKYLDRSWNSLKHQTIGIENLQCIFVNDMSNDNGATLAKLMEIEKEAPKSVFVVNMEEKGGPGGCRNVGITYATGEYLEFLDSDDELTPVTCQRLYECAKDNSADIVQFNHLNISGDKKWSSGRSEETKLYSIDSKFDRVPFLIGSIVSYGITNKLYSMSLVRKADVYFPANLRYEEPLFVYPLFLYAKKVYILEENLYIYYRRTGSIVTSEVGNKLINHPTVQLMLLEELMRRGSLFYEYKEAIEIYFLWSFYCETLIFSRRHGKMIPLEYFKGMQKTCRRFFPDWRNNSYIVKEDNPTWSVLESIDKEISSQEELMELIEEAYILLG